MFRQQWKLCRKIKELTIYLCFNFDSDWFSVAYVQCEKKLLLECLSYYESDYRFTFLPANSTDLCQPLDVAVCKFIKSNWSTVLREWKKKYKGVLPKSVFPSLLKRTIDRIVHLDRFLFLVFKQQV